MKEQTGMLLRDQGLDPLDVSWIVENALREDLGSEHLDVTSVATIPADQIDTADIIARERGVLAGLAVAAAVFEAAGPGAEVTFVAQDGDFFDQDDVLATITGPTRTLLAAERTALNLLCRMSGVATYTRAWVKELAGNKAQLLDTRKTTPGLRVLEKYAVRAGGGTNKRMGLYDVAMIKDNHKLAAGSITAAFERVRAAYPEITVQVEVTTVDEAREAVAAGATFLLLDNMAPDLLREVVAAVGEKAELEATGGLTLDWAAKFAETGVDYLSVGALTHSSPIVDIALDLRPRK
ncbi:MAG TPA: carboxylating nicotinate-nucleotide diphosphorylase [Micromonosporaceae bacterium]|nr:carboxylating nicotinate-nucleotide diphosphorylase [Micromonosporaceae bacterium]HCU49597.1 carboxylating nicotinate-nucleotide diphosphorylase [Micromonosporaceae bacterium]